MAAVLFSGCGEVCSGACEVCGAICQLPCRLCNTVCGGCGNVCESACYTISQLCSSPFSIYVTVATIFNVPSVYLGVVSATTEGLVCNGSRWLFFNTLFAVVNVIAAIYMAVVVVKQQPPSVMDQQGIMMAEEGGGGGHNYYYSGSTNKPSTAFGRAGHLLCYDPWMALYIVILLGFFLWLWAGAIWSLSGKIYNGCNGDGSIQGKVAIALGFGWAFIFFGVGALCCGLCCAYCYDDTTTSSSATTINYYNHPATAATATAAAQKHHAPYVVNPDNNIDNSNKKAASTTPAFLASETKPAPKNDPPIAQAVLY